jgi:hypothetical protein
MTYMSILTRNLEFPPVLSNPQFKGINGFNNKLKSVTPPGCESQTWVYFQQVPLGTLRKGFFRPAGNERRLEAPLPGWGTGRTTPKGGLWLGLLGSYT